MNLPQGGRAWRVPRSRVRNPCRLRDDLAFLVLALLPKLGHASLFSDAGALRKRVVTACLGGAMKNQKIKNISGAPASRTLNLPNLSIPAPPLASPQRSPPFPPTPPFYNHFNGHQRSKRAKQFSTPFGTYEKPGFPCVSSIVRSPSGLAT